ncbi:MAG: MFS transporter [Sphingomonadaceae bacterium]|nr:MFS transporter [Sphingomonadaceae bacterium]
MAEDRTVRQEWKAGWPVAIASLFGFSIPTIYVYSIGSFIAPLEMEFGWSRFQITAGLSMLTLTSAIFAPFVGMVVDRVGPRRVALPGALLLFSCFGLISLTTEDIWVWWGLWLLLAFGAVGCKPTVWTTAVASTFERGRGFALAVALAGSGLGTAVIPLLSTWLIDNYGWRSAPPIMSVIVGVIIFPILYFGLHSGADKESGARRSHQPEIETVGKVRTGMGAKEAFLSPNFAKIAFASFTFTLAGVGLAANFVPIMTYFGLSRGEAASIAGLAGISTIAGRLIAGQLLDRFNTNIVSAVSFLLPIISCVLLLWEPVTVPMTILAIMIFGFSLGSEIDIIAFLTAQQFGTVRYGTIFGVISGLWSLATASGPLLFSYIYDVTGGYDLAIKLIVPIFVLSSLCVLTLGKPPKFDA